MGVKFAINIRQCTKDAATWIYQVAADISIFVIPALILQSKRRFFSVHYLINTFSSNINHVKKEFCKTER